MDNKASKLQKLLQHTDTETEPDAELTEQAMSVSVIAPVLQALNDLRQRNLLKDYAIAGGIAVLYYTEPVLTYDFDVLCVFPGSGFLVDPTPVFEYLNRRGYEFGKEDRVNIEGIPVQFIPASAGLVEDALRHAVSVTISGVQTKILTVEHLIAMMLQLYRPKDRAKLDLLIHNDDVSLDMDVLHSLLTTYHLTRKWRRFSDE
jgi:hypothetical protein